MMVAKFSRFLVKRHFIRHGGLYKAGDLADKIFIIKKGEFEITRTLQRDMTKETEEVVEMFGYKP
jgi:CRP-like cAMP-binding protein